MAQADQIYLTHEALMNLFINLNVSRSKRTKNEFFQSTWNQDNVITIHFLRINLFFVNYRENLIKGD